MSHFMENINSNSLLFHLLILYNTSWVYGALNTSFKGEPPAETHHMECSNPSTPDRQTCRRLKSEQKPLCCCRNISLSCLIQQQSIRLRLWCSAAIWVLKSPVISELQVTPSLTTNHFISFTKSEHITPSFSLPGPPSYVILSPQKHLCSFSSSHSLPAITRPAIALHLFLFSASFHPFHSSVKSSSFWLQASADFQF